MYWLVELGPIDRNHACEHAERSLDYWKISCGRWERRLWCMDSGID